MDEDAQLELSNLKAMLQTSSLSFVQANNLKTAKELLAGVDKFSNILDDKYLSESLDVNAQLTKFVKYLTFLHHVHQMTRCPSDDETFNQEKYLQIDNCYKQAVDKLVLLSSKLTQV